MAGTSDSDFGLGGRAVVPPASIEAGGGVRKDGEAADETSRDLPDGEAPSSEAEDEKDSSQKENFPDWRHIPHRPVL